MSGPELPSKTLPAHFNSAMVRVLDVFVSAERCSVRFALVTHDDPIDDSSFALDVSRASALMWCESVGMEAMMRIDSAGMVLAREQKPKTACFHARKGSCVHCTDNDLQGTEEQFRRNTRMVTT